MKRTLLNGMIIFLITHTIFAQYDASSKVNILLYQTFRDTDDPDSWIFKDYTYHHYNGKGALESSIKYRYSQNHAGIPIKISESKNDYDLQGRLVSGRGLNYSYPSGDIEFMSDFHDTYEGEILIRNEFNIFYVKNNFKYTEIHAYDIDGHLIEKTDISDYGMDNVSTRMRSYQWDENGCLIESSFTTDDSASKIENDVSETCENLVTRYFLREETSMQFVLYSTIKYETEYDEHRNVIRKTELQKKEGIDSTFNTLAEELYFYDDKNRDTLTIHMDRYVNNPSFPINKYKNYKRYDNNGNIIYNYSEYWDTSVNAWIPGYETFDEYNQDNELIHSIAYGSFNIEENKFLSTIESQYEKDELNNEAYAYHKEEDLSQEPPFYSEREVREQYSCDDRTFKLSDADLIHGTGYTFEFSYFDQPECDRNSFTSSGLSVFPNPASEYIHFKLNYLPDEISVSLYDLSGKLMQCKPYNTSDFYSIDVSALLKGMYELKITIEDKTLINKFIKI